MRAQQAGRVSSSKGSAGRGCKARIDRCELYLSRTQRKQDAVSIGVALLVEINDSARIHRRLTDYMEPDSCPGLLTQPHGPNSDSKGELTRSTRTRRRRLTNCREEVGVRSRCAGIWGVCGSWVCATCPASHSFSQGLSPPHPPTHSINTYSSGHTHNYMEPKCDPATVAPTC